MKQTAKKTNIVTHDFITGFLIKLFNFVKKHKTVIITVTAVVVVVALAASLFCSYKERAYQNSWKAYFLKDKAALEAEFADSNAGLLFKYNAADALFAEGNYQDALVAYRAVEAGDNKELFAFAILGAAACYSALNEAENSLLLAQQFLADNPDHYASSQAYLLSALAQEKLGKKDDAKATYTLITERFAPGYFDTFAKNKLKEIK